MKSITRIFIGLSLLVALTSCWRKPQVEPVDAPPAANPKADSRESEASANDSDPKAEKPKTPFRTTRMRLPDMESLPDSQDLSPVSPTESGGAVIARPPVE